MTDCVNECVGKVNECVEKVDECVSECVKRDTVSGMHNERVSVCEIKIRGCARKETMGRVGRNLRNELREERERRGQCEREVRGLARQVNVLQRKMDEWERERGQNRREKVRSEADRVEKRKREEKRREETDEMWKRFRKLDERAKK